MTKLHQYIELLKEYGLWVSQHGITPESEIIGKPVTDSRQIQPGDIFICIKGYLSDGHKYIGRALEIGASLIIQEDEYSEHTKFTYAHLKGMVTGDGFKTIRVKNARKAAALLAKLYYDNPTGKLKLIGVTGTNGKTTTSMLLWQALTLAGNKTGWIGTLGYRISDEIIPTNNTTPDIMELNSIFHLMVEAGCRYVVMEVSSHALALDRVYGLEYDLAIFTNLSRDHLDFHKDMSDYAESKYKLFEYTNQNKGKSIIYTDDEFGRQIYDRQAADITHLPISVSEKAGDCLIKEYHCSLQGSELHLYVSGSLLNISETPFHINLQTNLIGHFNVLNIAMTFAALHYLQPCLTITQLQNLFSNLQPVRGRLEQVTNQRGIGVYVDYAHTPDALKSLLEAVGELPHNRILVLFGAGGNRDKGKRPEMLQEVLLRADAVVITDDNPRNENPGLIIREITEKADLWAPWWIIRDRRKAIESILSLAQPDDIVLLAGKGHETYQEINGKRYHFDDAEIATAYLTEPAAENDTELILPIDPLLLEILLKSSFVYHKETNDLTGNYYTQISTDSRNIKSSSLFVAIKGLNFNGMDYVADILKDQSCAAIVNRSLKDSIHTIYFNETQKALGMIARKYLKMFGAYRIALTGSTGKTTTKEILANIYSQAGKTLKTIANENNIIGLCKTIFRIRPFHKTAIFELGTNHFGEIAQLADICEPQTALITNIGPSHLEFLGDEEGVYFEKTALFRRKLDHFVFPGDDRRFEEYLSKGVSVGYNGNSTCKISDIVNPNGALSFCMAGMEWKTSIAMPFYISNIALAVATALITEQPVKNIQKGILLQNESKLRMDIRHYGNVTVIWDCYNANPDSMKAAIKYWNDFETGKPHIAILGDMLELGNNSIYYHCGIGELLSDTKLSNLITVGELAQYYQTGNSGVMNGNCTAENEKAKLKEFNHFAKVDELIKNDILKTLPVDSVILVKASHGMQLEKLIPVIESLFGGLAKSPDNSVLPTCPGKE